MYGEERDIQLKGVVSRSGTGTQKLKDFPVDSACDARTIRSLRALCDLQLIADMNRTSYLICW